MPRVSTTMLHHGVWELMSAASPRYRHLSDRGSNRPDHGPRVNLGLGETDKLVVVGRGEDEGAIVELDLVGGNLARGGLPELLLHVPQGPLGLAGTALHPLAHLEAKGLQSLLAVLLGGHASVEAVAELIVVEVLANEGEFAATGLLTPGVSEHTVEQHVHGVVLVLLGLALDGKNALHAVEVGPLLLEELPEPVLEHGEVHIAGEVDPQAGDRVVVLVLALGVEEL